jgi:outer membrane usher protein FimD/PapC
LIEASTTGISSSYSFKGSFAPSLFLNITKSSSSSGPSIFAGINIPLGSSGTPGRLQNFSLGMQHSDTGMTRTTDISSTSIEQTGLSAHVHRSDLGFTADGVYNGSSYEAGVSSPIISGSGYTAYARGAIGYSDGHVGMMKTVFSGYAMIDTGAPHIGVVLNNQPAGESGSDGTVFLSGLQSYIKSSISINAETAPANFDVVDTAVSTFPHAGVKVVFSATSAVMLEMPGITGLMMINGINYPITDRGAFIELPIGEYSGVVNGNQKIRFVIPAPLVGGVIQKIQISN